jgi:hypothetical protein
MTTVQAGAYSEGHEAGVQHERERCAAIVMAARFGELDQDFRAIIHMIEGGLSVEQLKR